MPDHARGQMFLSQLSRLRNELPFDPSLLRNLFAMTGDSSMASLDEIAGVISRDQGLTTRILTLANSAFYGLQSQVTSISRAVNVLGLKEVRNLVLALGVNALIAKHGVPTEFDIRLHWAHQLRVAAAAQYLAKNLPQTESPAPDPSMLFTAGLLHDIGKVIVAMHSPEDWQAIRSAMADGTPANQAEDAHWGLEHGLIGGMVLNQWNLPQQLSEPVNWHHSPDICEDFPCEARLLGLADSLVWFLEAGETRNSTGWETAAEGLGFDSGSIGPAVDAVVNDESLMQFIDRIAA